MLGNVPYIEKLIKEYSIELNGVRIIDPSKPGKKDTSLITATGFHEVDIMLFLLGFDVRKRRKRSVRFTRWRIKVDLKGRTVF